MPCVTSGDGAHREHRPGVLTLEDLEQPAQSDPAEEPTCALVGMDHLEVDPSPMSSREDLDNHAEGC